MKHKLLCITMILCLSAAALTGCNNSSDTKTSDTSKASSVVSAAEKEQSSMQESSEDSQESSEESSEEPSRTEKVLHGQKLTDIACKYRTDAELTEVITKAYDSLTSLNISDEEALPENPEIMVKTLELSFPVSESDLSPVIKKMIAAESYNIFIEKMWVSAEYDGFRCKLLMYHPYPKDDTSLSEDDVQSFVKDRFRAVDRANLMDALLSIHQNYHTQSLSTRFTPDSSNTIGINGKIDFNSYNSYSRYTYQVSHSDSFTLDKAEYTIEEEEWQEYPCHGEVVLRTDKFTL